MHSSYPAHDKTNLRGVIETLGHTHAGDIVLCRTDRLTGRATGLPAKSCRKGGEGGGGSGIRS